MQDLPSTLTSPLISANALAAHCKNLQFAPGDTLRREGQYYKNMYLIADGMVSVQLATDRRGKNVEDVGAGTPIGEIGFLKGCPATATVTAKTPVTVLVINDDTLRALELKDRSLAVRLSYFLAEISEVRLAMNSMVFGDGISLSRGSGIEMVLCRDEEMLNKAARLRYEVYCEELGRDSPYADHDRKILRDDLDSFGITFVSIEDGEVTGTIRGSRPNEGPIGMLEDIYGLPQSPYYPDATSICTKFLVKKSKRQGPTALKLVAALVRYGLNHGVVECFIDCVPGLLPYYRAFGFEVAGKTFFHYENGPSIPLVLDLEKSGRRLSRDPGMRETLTIYAKSRVYKWLGKRQANRTELQGTNT